MENDDTADEIGFPAEHECPKTGNPCVWEAVTSCRCMMCPWWQCKDCFYEDWPAGKWT